MVTVASAGVDLVPQLAAGFKRQASQMGSTFGKAFAAGAAVTAAVGAKLIGEAISEAGSLEQSIGAIDTVFKRSSGQMHRWAKGAAQDVGLTRNQFNELGTLIGSQLKNGGTAMDQLAPKTNKLITLGADLSSMFGGTTKEAVESLSSALKGERDPIEKYGVTLNQAKIDAEAAALGFKKVGNSFDNQAQQAATLSLIFKQTSDAQGNFAKESGTLQGQQQRLAAQWGDMKAKLGTVLLPVVSRFVGFLNRNMAPAISGLIGLFDLIIRGNYSDRLSKVFGWAEDSPIVSALLEIRDAIISHVQPVIEKFIGFLRDNPTVIKGAAIALGVLAGAIGLVSLAMGVLSIATSPITAIILLVAGLGAGIAYLWKNSQTFRAGVMLVWDALKAFAGFVRAEIIPVIQETARQVAEKLQPVWTAVANFFRTSVAPTLALIAGKLREWWPTIQQVVVFLARLIGKGIVLWATIQGKVIPIVVKIAGFLLRTLVPAVLGAIEIQGRFIGSLIEVGRKLVNAGRDAIAFAKKIGTAVGDAIQWFKDLPGKVKDAVGDAAEWLVQAGRDAIGGLAKGLKEGIEKYNPVNIVKDVGSSLIGGVKGILKSNSPSKRFIQIGKDVLLGLAIGINTNTGLVGKSIARVMTAINVALKKHDISKTMAKQARAIVNGIASQAAKLRNLIVARNELASSIAGNLRGEFDLSAIVAKNEFGISQGPGAAVQAAQAIVARMKAFAVKLVELMKAGLPGPLVQEVAGYGSVDGARIADVLLKASKSQIGSLKTSYAQFQKYANQAGVAAANATYGGRIEAQQESLEKAIERGLAKMGIRVDVGISRHTAARIYNEGKAVSDARK